jgi:hypothetical protein
VRLGHGRFRIAAAGSSPIPAGHRGCRRGRVSLASAARLSLPNRLGALVGTRCGAMV